MKNIIYCPHCFFRIHGMPDLSNVPECPRCTNRGLYFLGGDNDQTVEIEFDKICRYQVPTPFNPPVKASAPPTIIVRIRDASS